MDNTNNFINEGFEFKGIHFAPITAGSMMLMEKVKSDFMGDMTMKGIFEYLYIHGEDRSIVRKMAKDIERFEDAVMDYADQFTFKDLEQLGELIQAQVLAVTESQVDIVPKQ